ncbi:MAG TPA: dUTP diphosphatase [Candidatus Kapabacteria bacterium]|jgi:dUTP pyrophosphatase|nr:dUTP diphosphatase [Ignavibacteria bacterium]HRE56220.1 dUTP diphosphatase [Candidatus Kapabacteria bacterium]
MNDMNVQIKKLYTDGGGNNYALPQYATEGSAGMDICAFTDEPIIIAPGSIALVPTGLAIALPQGFECQVRSRSGLAAKQGVFCLNAPGTIDSDYRGEIKVILANFGKEDFTIRNGDRIAQIVIARYEHIQWEIVETLGQTQRGEGGFGSTGTQSFA